eukprot:3671610-Rhodomonas_salina.3
MMLSISSAIPSADIVYATTRRSNAQMLRPHSLCPSSPGSDPDPCVPAAPYTVLTWRILLPANILSSLRMSDDDKAEKVESALQKLAKADKVSALACAERSPVLTCARCFCCSALSGPDLARRRSRRERRKTRRMGRSPRGLSTTW